MKFGPEIKVDGKRPEWLTDHDMDAGYQEFRYEGDRWIKVYGSHWPYVQAIRLPANHPHYATPTPDERAVAPELVERMRALIETMASCDGAAFVLEYKEQARAIVAALEPVDEHEEVAKRILGYASNGLMSQGQRITMIKNELRGRQLEKEGK